jgi:hypothetical protein
MSNYLICATHVFPNGTLLNGQALTQNAAVIETGAWQEVSLPVTGQDASGNARVLSLLCQPDVDVWVAITPTQVAPVAPTAGVRVYARDSMPLGILPGQFVYVKAA